MPTSKIEAYSVWFIPNDEEVAKQLTDIINDLADRHGGKIFTPHSRLVGCLKKPVAFVKEQTLCLAQQIKPFSMYLTHAEMETRPNISKAVYLHAVCTPALNEAYQHACEILEHYEDVPFEPHLTLLYGDFPLEVKQQIVREIGTNFPAVVPITHLYLIGAPSRQPSSWYIIDAFPLQG